MHNIRPAALVPPPRTLLSEKIAWDSREVAQAVGISERYVRELAAAGVFRTTKLGKKTLFDPQQVRSAIFDRKGE